MSREFLEQVENIRYAKILHLSNKNNSLEINNMPENLCCLYWIYTNYSINELKNCGDKIISTLANLHDGLNNICTVKDPDGFLLVYNGIAKNKSKSKVQEKEYNRMKQHFGKGNLGNLGIGKINALNDPLKWRISYVTLQVNDNDEADIMCKYDDHAENLERIWRLEYGWSLLCQK